MDYEEQHLVDEIEDLKTKSNFMKTHGNSLENESVRKNDQKFSWVATGDVAFVISNALARASKKNLINNYNLLRCVVL